MKVTLDLTKLLAEGKITPQEAERFRQLASRATFGLAIRIVMVFGALGVAGGLLLLLIPLLPPNILDALGHVFAFLFGTANGLLLTTALLMGAAVLLRSGFVITLAAISLFAFLGSSTYYWHASYALEVRQPTLTVTVFTALGCGAAWLANRLKPDYERLAIIFARVCLFFVNFGFWVGSLWGDRRIALMLTGRQDWAVSAGFFAVVWAVALGTALVWAAKHNRRAMVNIVATFAGIHFYTQWFEYFSASPATLLLAGLAAIAMAWGLSAWNRRLARQPPVVSAALPSNE